MVSLHLVLDNGNMNTRNNNRTNLTHLLVDHFNKLKRSCKKYTRWNTFLKIVTFIFLFLSHYLPMLSKYTLVN